MLGCITPLEGHTPTSLLKESITRLSPQEICFQWTESRLQRRFLPGSIVVSLAYCLLIGVYFASVIALINDRLVAAGKPVLGFLNPLYDPKRSDWLVP